MSSGDNPGGGPGGGPGITSLSLTVAGGPDFGRGGKFQSKSESASIAGTLVHGSVRSDL